MRTSVFGVPFRYFAFFSNSTSFFSAIPVELLLLRLFRFYFVMLSFATYAGFNGYFAALDVCDYIPGINFFSFVSLSYNFIV